jgi:hypothetical protein
MKPRFTPHPNPILFQLVFSSPQALSAEKRRAASDTILSLSRSIQSRGDETIIELCKYPFQPQRGDMAYQKTNNTPSGLAYPFDVGL